MKSQAGIRSRSRITAAGRSKNGSHPGQAAGLAVVAVALCVAVLNVAFLTFHCIAVLMAAQ